MRLLSTFVVASISFAGVALAQAPKAGDPANTLVLELKGGKVSIQLRPDLAPKHVERVKQLAKDGFYNGLKWHRVINGFMAQSGDPTGTGTGGSKYGNLPAEFTKETYKRGTVGAARTNDPNTANSQFFICFTNDGCGSLTGQYTVWGQVVDGMAAVDAITKGAGGSGQVASPDTIVKGYLASNPK